MREDYTKTDQKKIEQHYAQQRESTKPDNSTEHGCDCICEPCYDEWAWSTGFETANPEGRKRQKDRDDALAIKPKVPGFAC